MARIKNNYLHLIERYHSLSLRERILIAAALLVILQMLWDSLLWTPLKLEEDRISSDMAQVNVDLKRLRVEIDGLTRRLKLDPDADVKTRIRETEEKIDALETGIRQAAEALVEPTEMARLLERLLAKQTDLDLVRLETMPRKSLVKTATQGEAQEGKKELSSSPNVFAHGFAVEFEGDYFSTLKYLDVLEALPWRFFWDGIHYQVEDYPRARVRIELHTLSLSEGWIGV